MMLFSWGVHVKDNPNFLLRKSGSLPGKQSVSGSAYCSFGLSFAKTPAVYITKTPSSGFPSEDAPHLVET